MDIKKAHLNGRPKECSSKPWASVKRPSEPGICHFAKCSEWRFSNHRTKARLRRQRLENLSRAHRLAKSKHAIWMIVSFDPVHPATNVVRFFQSVRRQIAAAVAVSAGVRKENDVMICGQPGSYPETPNRLSPTPCRSMTALPLGAAGRICQPRSTAPSDAVMLTSFNSEPLPESAMTFRLSASVIGRLPGCVAIQPRLMPPKTVPTM
jgi:hypothetical protein